MKKKSSASRQIINTCDRLTLAGFMRCLYDGDFSALVISGKFSEEEQREAWLDVFEQYSFMTDNDHYQRLLKAMNEFRRLSGKMLAIRAFLTATIYKKYDRENVLMIRSLFPNLKLNPEDQEGWTRDIQRLISNAKTLQIMCDMQLSEIDRIKNEGKKDNGGREVFVDGMIIIGKWMGFRIDPEKVYVSEYARMQKQYNEYCDRLKAKQQGGK